MTERCRKQNTEFTGRQAWLGRVRQLLAAQLPAAPGLDKLAEQLNCSPRTLRRHLHDLGSSYQELLDELRSEQAKQWLATMQCPSTALPSTWVSARPPASVMPCALERGRAKPVRP